MTENETLPEDFQTDFRLDAKKSDIENACS